MELPFAESWKIKMVEPLRKSTREEREQWIREADYNLFQLKSDQVYIDCLTDSGTGAMSDRQWAAMMMGDESYAGSSSFFMLKDTISRITGFEYVIPTHQGRAAENVLFSHLVTAGSIVPGNSHFDTTKGHIESRKAFAVDCTVDEAKDTQLEVPFKGNVDPVKLEKVLAENADKVPTTRPEDSRFLWRISVRSARLPTNMARGSSMTLHVLWRMRISSGRARPGMQTRPSRRYARRCSLMRTV